MRAIFSLTLFTCMLFGGPVDNAVDDVKKTHVKRASTQQEIDNYADAKESLYEEYLNLEKALQEQQSYNRQLEMIVATQEKELPKIEKQLLAIDDTQKKIVPLMFDMVDTLEQLIAADSPFLHDERQNRLEHLKSYMANPDITLAEQFRLIVESYKIEYGYARTIEVYRSNLGEKTVDILRIGRLGLYYQSLDLMECGIYDLKAGSWKVLDSSYNDAIRKAIRMAKKQIAPDFLMLPVLASKGAI